MLINNTVHIDCNIFQMYHMYILSSPHDLYTNKQIYFSEIKAVISLLMITNEEFV